MCNFKKWKAKQENKETVEKLRSEQKISDLDLPTPVSQEQEIGTPIQVHLGLDFGTVWTKVAYRVLNQEYSGDVPFHTGGKDAVNYIRSRVFLDGHGVLHTLDFMESGNGNVDAAWKTIDYLKMVVLDKQEDSPEFKAATFFLSRVIRAARIIVQNELLLIRTGSVEWSASLGIPTEYKNSPKERIYITLLKKAWALSDLWEKSSIDDRTLDELILTAKLSRLDIPLSVLPELQANIFALTHGPAVPDGIYALFDIGGGTMDGSFFRLERSNGTRQVEVIRAIVDPYGCEVVKNKLSKGFGNGERMYSSAEIENILFTGDHHPHYDPRINSSLTDPIYKHVAEIVHGGRRATMGDPAWRMNTFNFILCGGGAFYEWYHVAIEHTYLDRNLRRCGIPRFQKFAIPEPGEDFQYNSLKTAELPRFFLAYGLSFPEEDHHQVIGFPEHYPELSPVYRDTMTERWNRLNEWYGEADV